MNRKLLYGLIFVLSVVIGGVYLSKTKGGINKIFAPASKANDSWIKEDPGWDKTRSEPQDTEPKAEPFKPPEIKPDQPKPDQPNRRRKQPQPN